MTTARELELKVALTGPEMDRLQAHPILMQLAIGDPASRQLRSVYFDTPDRKLYGQGLSLRLRRVGEDWVQTVKCGTGVRSGVSHPVELEATVEGPAPNVAVIPDKAVRKRVKKLVGKTILAPQFETVVQRTTRRLRGPEGAEIEVAFDKGVVRGAEGAKDLCEAELELKTGHPEALVHVAETLFADETIRFTEASKADLGYHLSEQEEGAKLKPLKASTPQVDRTQSCAEAFREISRAAADQILHNWAVVLHSDDPEGTHQMRIGVRRLRSALKILRPVLDSEALRAVEQDTRDLARLLSELRDADALATDIVDPAAASREADPDLAALKGVLASTRATRREKVRAELKGRPWSSLQVRLTMLPECIDRLADQEGGTALDGPIGKVTSKGLAKRWRRVVESGRRLDELSATERHEMRKDLKTLRYSIELVAPIYRRKDVRRFTTKLRHLQDMFGYLNDVEMAEKLKLIPAAGVTSETDLQRAVGYVIGWHTARAERTWTEIGSAWKRLAKSKPFWT